MLGFQKAMCDLIASPDLCKQLIESPDEVLRRYDLSDRDRHRLQEVVQQPGMVVNCALYRANRLAPIYNLLPDTCFLLGDKLIAEAIEFWKDFDQSRLQFNEEVERFGDFLRKRIALGVHRDAILADVLEYELVVNKFRFMQRSEVLARVESANAAVSEAGRIYLHPLIRVLLFRHEPRALLALLSDRCSPPFQLEQGEFWLLLDAKAEELQTKVIPSDLGRLLAAIDAESELAMSDEDVQLLKESGLVVRSIDNLQSCHEARAAI